MGAAGHCWVDIFEIYGYFWLILGLTGRSRTI